jgi:hypothetical protein
MEPREAVEVAEDAICETAGPDALVTERALTLRTALFARAPPDAFFLGHNR